MIARLLFLTMLAVALAAAAPLGYMDLANCTGGGVTVTSTTIDWTLPAGDPNGCMQSGGVTNVTYTGGGPLVAGVSGLMKDLTLATVFPVIDYMTFTGNGNLHLNLTSIGPGVGNTVCATTFGSGPDCSVFAGSPFILSPTATGTSVTLSVFGVATDGSAQTTVWSGGYTTQITGVTAAAIQSNILAGGSLASTYSASFVVGEIPEPGTIGMVLLGGLLIGGARLYRRRRSE